MNGDEIRPADVFEKVEHLYRVVIWLAWLTGIMSILVLFQIVAKALIFSRVLAMLRRVETLLQMAERHGQITDARAADMKSTTIQAAKTLAAVVNTAAAEIKTEVPPRVAAELQKGAGDSGVLPRPGAVE